MRELDQEKLDKGVAKIEKQLARAVDKGKLEQSDADAIRARGSLPRLTTATSRTATW